MFVTCTSGNGAGSSLNNQPSSAGYLNSEIATSVTSQCPRAEGTLCFSMHSFYSPKKSSLKHYQLTELPLSRVPTERMAQKLPFSGLAHFCLPSSSQLQILNLKLSSLPHVYFELIFFLRWETASISLSKTGKEKKTEEYLSWPHWIWEYDIHNLRLHLQTQQQYVSGMCILLSYENGQILLLKTCKKPLNLNFQQRLLSNSLINPLLLWKV